MTPSVPYKGEVAAEPETVKPPRIPVIHLSLVVVVAIFVSVGLLGGAVYWLAMSGRLPGFASNAKTAEKAPVVVVPPKTHAVVLEPILANLADPGGSAYLRVSITLRVLDAPVVAKAEAKPEKGKPVNEEEAAVRDSALDVIGRCTAVDLLQTEGKEKLKRDLAKAIAQHVPEIKVTGIYFTEFLVQQ